MSHTTMLPGYTFIHDGDALEGRVRIVDEKNGNILYIPGEILLEFVGQQIANKMIAEIEMTKGATLILKQMLGQSG